MPDPTERVNKTFDTKTASNTILLKQKEKPNPAIPSELPKVSDEDAGW